MSNDSECVAGALVQILILPMQRGLVSMSRKLTTGQTLTGHFCSGLTVAELGSRFQNWVAELFGYQDKQKC